MKKIRVGILFGGRSGEHEVSLLSAASVLQAIDRKKYDVIPIGITKEGRWVTAGHAERLLAGAHSESGPEKHLRAGDPASTSAAAILRRGESVLVPPVPSEALVPFERDASSLAPSSADPAGSNQVLSVDVIFPVLHGTFGEDGTIQGLFELAGIAYVGSGVLGSATGMDKDTMHRLFASAKLPIVKWVTFLRGEWEKSPRKVRARIEATLKYPVFVKPANLGSSVGITKAHNAQELGPAIEVAARYDRKIVVEQGVGGKKKPRELEVAVLGNDDPEASVVGEVVPGKEFYDYEAKYLSEGSDLIVPAKLTKAQTKQVRAMALRAFQACDCAGLARVDFLMEPGKSGRLYVNEINTLPGFTSISMYPRLWAASGVSYPQLIDRLIQLAIERRTDKDRNHYSL
ncbi:MAG TPA: D-alanine--D-alanine ligase family protein [Acidobacteriaceae bacterium]|jgi:D-alanine-D-alanine ligase|nr:D-alanine--D-alanine ligase family protein [Acidobacteriaceae bacterium]